MSKTEIYKEVKEITGEHSVNMKCAEELFEMADVLLTTDQVCVFEGSLETVTVLHESAFDSLTERLKSGTLKNGMACHVPA